MVRHHAGCDFIIALVAIWNRLLAADSGLQDVVTTSAYWILSLASSDEKKLALLLALSLPESTFQQFDLIVALSSIS